MEQNNNHFFNLQNSIELENAFQERQRTASQLRLGNVPAHVRHPIVEALLRGRVRRGAAMDVDADAADEPMDVGDMGGTITGRAVLNHAHTQYTTGEMLMDRNNGVSGLAEFDKAAYALAHVRKMNKPPNVLDPEVLKRYNFKVRARNASYLLKATRPWRAR